LASVRLRTLVPAAWDRLPETIHQGQTQELLKKL